MRTFHSFEDLQATKNELSESEQNLLAFKNQQKKELRDLRSNLKQAATIETENELLGIERILSEQKPELLESLAGYLDQQNNIESAYQAMINSKRKGGDTDQLKKLWQQEKDKLEKTYHVNEFTEEILDQKKQRNPKIKKSRALDSLIRQQRFGALNNDKRAAIQDIIANIQEGRRKEITKVKLAIIYTRSDNQSVRSSVINDYVRLLKREFSSDQNAQSVKFDDRENLYRRAEEDLERKSALLRRIMMEKGDLKEEELESLAVEQKWSELKAA